MPTTVHIVQHVHLINFETQIWTFLLGTKKERKKKRILSLSFSQV